MGRIVINVFGSRCRPKKHGKAAKRFTFRWATGAQSFVEGLMARITNEQQVPVTVAPKTAAGRPAVIDGAVVFTSSDPAVCTVVSTGPLTAMVTAVAPGVAQITAVFDVDLDAGQAREIIVFGTPALTPLP